MTESPIDAVAGRFGGLLRALRRDRRISQLELSSASGVSTRHLSFIENGRSRPSREMVGLLARQLGLPVRERNSMLVAAGFAPELDQWSWYCPEMAAAPGIVTMMLAKHLPYPAAVSDGLRNVLAANAATAVFTDLISPDLRTECNIFRMTLHPDGLAPHLVNFAQIRRHQLAVLRHMASTAQDPRFNELLAEVEGYPVPRRCGEDAAAPIGRLGVPALLRRDGHVLHFFKVIATFCTATDSVITPMNLETLYPGDAETERLLREWYG